MFEATSRRMVLIGNAGRVIVNAPRGGEPGLRVVVQS
jgi:hypothetical protein